ncbi:hypothetical protein Cantr_09844 [Candida viswanathii]|uniref:Uncharacterized protein n=1 Tax=Candida viswanathii TaxID=5486 RepID=A0A367YE29_9ASCO|nr:hypothetical protein Cantr_09844 [Candida viswanathii]
MEDINQSFKERMERKANLRAPGTIGSSGFNSCTPNLLKSSNVRFKSLSPEMDSSQHQPNTSANTPLLFDLHELFASIADILGIQECASGTDAENLSLVVESIKQMKLKLEEEQKLNISILRLNQELESWKEASENTIRELSFRANQSNAQFEQVMLNIGDCELQIEAQERESITKRNEAEKRIKALNTEVYKLKEAEVELKEENGLLRSLQPEIERLKTRTEELSLEIKTLETKNSNLKKLAKERELKCEKLASQLTSTRTKYSNKLKALATESGKTIDSLVVELKLVKDINQKLLSNAVVTTEEVKNAQTRTFNELYEEFRKTPNNYIEKVYENRYLSLLHALKQANDSNEIHHTTTESLLQLISDCFEKLPALTYEHVVYFRTLIKEFHQRKMLKNDDIDFIKKILGTYNQMMEAATDETVLACITP